MKIENNTITFEVDEKNLKAFQLAISILEQDPEEAFREWTRRLSYLAMRKSSGDESNTGDPMYSSFRNPERAAILRVGRWAERPKTMHYNMIKSYFIQYNKNESHEVKRVEMMQSYLNLEFLNQDRKNEETFLRNFRMMCSSSAYGDIFNYDGQTQWVTINPKIATDFMAFKDKFLQPIQ